MMKMGLHNMAQQVTMDGLLIAATEACGGDKLFHR